MIGKSFEQIFFQDSCFWKYHCTVSYYATMPVGIIILIYTFFVYKYWMITSRCWSWGMLLKTLIINVSWTLQNVDHVWGICGQVLTNTLVDPWLTFSINSQLTSQLIPDQQWDQQLSECHLTEMHWLTTLDSMSAKISWLSTEMCIKGIDQFFTADALSRYDPKMLWTGVWYYANIVNSF